MKKLLALVAALMMLAAPAWAQTGAEEVEIVDINGSRYPEGGQTQMVVEFRNFATAPDPAAVEVTADGQAVSDLVVEPVSASAVPVGVVLVIDASGSMEGAPIESAKAAATSFIAQARTEDRIAIVSFADQVQVLSGFTNNKDALNQAVGAIVAAGETAFNDGVIQGISMFADANAADLLPNMVVLSDGDDTASEATLEEAVAAVEGSNVRTFGVALESPDFNPEPVQQIATAGGGLFLSTPDPEALSTLYGEIGQEISNTLVARFVSPISSPGDVEFAVAYQGLTASQTFAVSGYAVTTTTSQITTTTSLAPLTTVVVESGAALSIDTLILIGAAGLGLTIFLFLIILFGREDDDDPGRFSKRLAGIRTKGQGHRGGEEVLPRSHPPDQPFHRGGRGRGAQARPPLRRQRRSGAGQHPDVSWRGHPRHDRALCGGRDPLRHLQRGPVRRDRLRGPADAGGLHDPVDRWPGEEAVREAAPRHPDAHVDLAAGGLLAPPGHRGGVSEAPDPDGS